MKVLVADDSRSTLAMMKAVVSRAGHEVCEANNGRDALEILQRHPAPPLAVLDWQMPKMDGIDVCRAMRAEEKSGLPYIIMVTARSDRDSLTAAFEAGTDDFVTKPYNVEELTARIRAGARIVELNRRNQTYIFRLQHRQKLESVGRLSASIAQEINTPCRHIGDNFRFLNTAFTEICSIVDIYDTLENELLATDAAAAFLARIRSLKESADYEYLREQAPAAAKQGIEGIETVSKIVNALHELTGAEANRKTASDLEHMLRVAAAVSEGEWRPLLELTLRVPKGFPPVVCNPADIQLVFILLFLRAAAAVREQEASKSNRKTITVRAAAMGDYAEIRFGDSGPSISAEHREGMFAPIYSAVGSTEKPETTGMSAAYEIVVGDHGGSLQYSADTSWGNLFTVRLPLDG